MKKTYKITRTALRNRAFREGVLVKKSGTVEVGKIEDLGALLQTLIAKK